MPEPHRGKTLIECFAKESQKRERETKEGMVERARAPPKSENGRQREDDFKRRSTKKRMANSSTAQSGEEKNLAASEKRSDWPGKKTKHCRRPES